MNDSDWNKYRLAAALRVKSEAQDLGDASIGQDWVRRIDLLLEKKKCPPQSKVKAHRDRTVDLNKAAKLELGPLLVAIDKLIETLD